MATIQISTNIWQQMTTQQRDDTLAAVGFTTLFPIQSSVNGEIISFSQDIGATGDVDTGPPGTPPGPEATVGAPILQAGDDLRDVLPISVITQDAPAITNAPIAGSLIAIAGRALKLVLGGGGGRLTVALWNSLPTLVRSTLTSIGIIAGTTIAFNGDIPFITLPFQGGDPETGIAAPGGVLDIIERPVDIQIGTHFSHGATVIGSWNTNPKNPADGVTFYRLSNGWLAVQNKKGRWKTWKPKRPIVLYASGAKDLKTMLRADKALNKQAKKLAAMLNRRAPRRQKAAPAAHKAVVIDV